MRIVFLTADDPIYLPDFFDAVLGEFAGRTALVGATQPLYRNQSSRAAAIRYLKTFGFGDTVRLTLRVLSARLRGRSIANVCRRHGVAHEEVGDVNAEPFLSQLRALAPDVVVSVSCPQIFGPELLGIPRLGVINVHGALLPKYRGVLPGFWMLANSEPVAGVSVHFVDAGIDTGDVCGQESFEIRPGESLDAFLRRSKAIAARLLARVLSDLEAGRVERRPIDRASGSYFAWPDRAAVGRFRAAGRSMW